MNSLRRSLVFDAVPTIFKQRESLYIPKITEQVSTSIGSDNEFQIDLEPKKQIGILGRN